MVLKADSDGGPVLTILTANGPLLVWGCRVIATIRSLSLVSSNVFSGNIGIPKLLSVAEPSQFCLVTPNKKTSTRYLCIPSTYLKLERGTWDLET